MWSKLGTWANYNKLQLAGAQYEPGDSLKGNHKEHHQDKLDLRNPGPCLHVSSKRPGRLPVSGVALPMAGHFYVGLHVGGNSSPWHPRHPEPLTDLGVRLGAALPKKRGRERQNIGLRRHTR